MKLSTKQKQIQGHREQTCGCQGGGEREWKLGVGRHKLLHLEWISNKVLLYSTGNYIQFPGTDHDEDNIKQYVFCIILHTHTHTHTDTHPHTHN